MPSKRQGPSAVGWCSGATGTNLELSQRSSIKEMQDVTQGYGPEMFTLPKAAAGKYQVRVKYFAHGANRSSTWARVYATVYEGFGTPQERVTRRTVTLVAG